MRMRDLLVVTGAALVAASSAGAVNSYMFGFTPFGGVQDLILNGGATVIQSSVGGWIDDTGLGNGGTGNYIVGNCAVSGCNGTDGEYRDYLVFDLSGVSGPITSATLSLWNPSNGFNGDPATYTNWDVTTSLGELESGSLAAYADLGSGIQYASTAVGLFDNGTQVGITLDGAAVAALNAAEGGSFVVGGALNGGTVPEPATWTMMLVGFGVAGATLRGSRRQRASA
jgi:hypothetical protein